MKLDLIQKFRRITEGKTWINQGKPCTGFHLDLDKQQAFITCDYLIASPGRAGSEWFSEQCKELNITMINNQIDVGVRVELPAKVFEHITDEIYEAKLKYQEQNNMGYC